MKSRLIALTIAIFAALSSLAMQGPDDRALLYVFCGPGPNGGPCGPCELFKRDYAGPESRLRNSLIDDFRSVVIYDVRTQPSLAKSYEVDRWPTFLAVDGRGNVLRKVVGYHNAYKLWQDMTRQSEKPQVPDQVVPVTQSKLLPKPATPKPETEYLPPNPDPVPLIPATPAAVDRPTPKPATLEGPDPVPPKPATLEPVLTAPVECPDGVCSLPVPVAGSSVAASSQPPVPDAGRITPPSPVAGSSDAGSSDSGSRTGDKWLSVLKWGATTAITIAAPEIAVPASIGLTAIGYGLSWMRRRRTGHRGLTPSGSPNNVATNSAGSVAVIRDTETRPTTTNHYVVKETDRKGEAYKEALRRTVAAYKSDKPGIVDVAGQIEHVAQEILRGQNVEHRASTAPRPGIWTDEDLH